ncbi:MAG: glycosyltransferase family 4 protein, partial [Bacteroidia bacterium]|nr:glycosyltransferase family 4 protein [Bacteroidia bacterium]
MKLLILTQYFPPEVGAPQNRLFELALRLKSVGVDVTVLTAFPNYPQMQIYKGYEGKNYMYEEMQGLKVHRASIYVSSNRSIISRLRNYFSFVRSSVNVGKKNLEDHYDFLMCESPPLFLGYSAMSLAKSKNAKLIFNVSDLWPESAEKLGVVNNKFLLKMAYNLEAKLYKRSALVTGQTQGICKNINSRFPSVKTYWLPNGVDLDFYDPAKIETANWRTKNNLMPNDFIVLYAGIIGIAQGLEVILKAAAQLKDKPAVKFVLLGNGPEKERLQQLKAQMQLTNVVFIEGVSKNEMRGVLKEVNAAVIPLRKLDLFLGAIPSKIFENLAMKIPVLLGVDGEARDLFVNQGKCALYVEPENENDLAAAVSKLYEDKALQK